MLAQFRCMYSHPPRSAHHHNPAKVKVLQAVVMVAVVAVGLTDSSDLKHFSPRTLESWL